MLSALRSLVRTPGFTLLALFTLALGIGVNTSMVGVVQALLYRSAPFPEPERLVQIVGAGPQGRAEVFSAVEVREIREHAGGDFSALSALGRARHVVVEEGRPTGRLNGMTATADFFETFGVQPMLGRAFTAEEAQPGRNGVVVISHRLWQQRYGGRADVLGRTLRLDGETVEIIGVMPAVFDYRMLWGETALWRPLAYTREQLEWRDYRAFMLIGRMRAAGDGPRIGEGLAVLAGAQAREHPQTYGGFRYRVPVLHEALMDDLGRRLTWLLLGLSGFVLLIACANIASLQLARAVAGARDMAIRAALGASRGRLVLRQMAESAWLVLGGGSLGLVIAHAINRVVEQRFLIAGGAGLEVRLDASVLGVTLLVALGAAVLFGLVPAWIASRTDVNAVLKQQSRGSTAGRGHHRMRRALVIAEVALAVILLGGAGVMHRGFAKFLDRAPGWDADRVLIGTLPVPESRIDNDADRVAFFRRLEARLAALPGVERAAIATSTPVFDHTGERQVLLEGQSPGAATHVPSAFHVMVTPGYFETVGVRLVEGRLFPEDIEARSPRVIVINHALARRLWPEGNAIGQRLCSMDSGHPFWAEVIGVVADVESAASLRAPTTPYVVYKPLVHEPWGWVQLVARTSSPEGLRDAFRRAVEEVDPEMPADWISTVREQIDGSQHNLQLAARTLSAFAGIGLLLAAVGIYGVIAQLVAQRTGEFGIRLALGATPRDILGLVLRHGLILTATGLLLGLAGAAALARFLGASMPRLVSLDPLALAAVAALLLVVAVAACLIPARRATRVDPLEALRGE